MSTPPDLGPLPEPDTIAYLYHDAASADQADPMLHSTLVVLQPDRRLNCRNETPLVELAKAREIIEAERQRCYMLGVAAEREACVAVCDVTPPYPFRPSIEAAHAIRQRAQTAAPSEPTKEGG